MWFDMAKLVITFAPPQAILMLEWDCPVAKSSGATYPTGQTRTSHSLLAAYSVDAPHPCTSAQHACEHPTSCIHDCPPTAALCACKSSNPSLPPYWRPVMPPDCPAALQYPRILPLYCLPSALCIAAALSLGVGPGSSSRRRKKQPTASSCYCSWSDEGVQVRQEPEGHNLIAHRSHGAHRPPVGQRCVSWSTNCWLDVEKDFFFLGRLRSYAQLLFTRMVPLTLCMTEKAGIANHSRTSNNGALFCSSVSYSTIPISKIAFYISCRYA